MNAKEVQQRMADLDKHRKEVEARMERMAEIVWKRDEAMEDAVFPRWEDFSEWRNIYLRNRWYHRLADRIERIGLWLDNHWPLKEEKHGPSQRRNR
jgi:hemerythrin superfamily protein